METIQHPHLGSLAVSELCGSRVLCAGLSEVEQARGVERHETAESLLSLRHTGWYADAEGWETYYGVVYVAERNDVGLSQAGDATLRQQGFLVFNTAAPDAPVDVAELEPDAWYWWACDEPCGPWDSFDEAQADASGEASGEYIAVVQSTQSDTCWILDGMHSDAQEAAHEAENFAEALAHRRVASMPRKSCN